MPSLEEYVCNLLDKVKMTKNQNAIIQREREKKRGNKLNGPDLLCTMNIFSGKDKLYLGHWLRSYILSYHTLRNNFLYTHQHTGSKI